eukprot:803652-Pelagomonas_calceolata.AAC.1
MPPLPQSSICLGVGAEVWSALVCFCHSPGLFIEVEEIVAHVPQVLIMLAMASCRVAHLEDLQSTYEAELQRRSESEAAARSAAQLARSQLEGLRDQVEMLQVCLRALVRAC